MSIRGAWRRFIITIETLSPLLVSDRWPYQTFQACLDYIPGGVIRGSLGDMMFRVSPEEGSQLFLEGESPLFRDALYYPPDWGSRDRGRYLYHGWVQKCKDCEGENPRESKPMDTLVDVVSSRLVETKIGEPFPYGRPLCPQNTAHELRKADEKGPPKQIHTRVALSRRRRAALEEMLYTLEAIEPGIRFSGEVIVPEEKVQLLLKWLPELKRLGAETTRGFGKAKIRLEKAGDRPSVEDRLADFNNKLRAAWGKHQETCQRMEKKLPNLDRTYFPLQLVSPLILRKDAFFTQLTIDPESLKFRMMELTGGSLPDLHLILSCSGAKTVSGWNSLEGLPKPVDMAIDRGSIFIYECQEASPFFEPLSRLDEMGMGERREEGLGEVVVYSGLEVQHGGDS